MALDERPYYRDPGYSPNRFTAIFSGSVPLFTAFGIRVRAHSALLFLIACEIILNWTPGYGLASKLASMGVLFLIILLHEYGHCITARLVGGSASEILLWPLGGLAYPSVPERPAPNFWTSAGGPFVNVIICFVTAALVYLLTGSRLSLNPFHGYIIPDNIYWNSAAFYLWWTFRLSYMLLLFNLLPIYPLDGGQMAQALLWHFIGHRRSMLIATLTGMFGAVILAIVGLFEHQFLLSIVAIWLFIACYQRRMYLRETGALEPWQGDEVDYASSLRPEPVERRRRRSVRARRAARKHARQEAAERQYIDSILAKVSAQGMPSLTWRERRALRKATEKLRQSEQEMKNILGE